MEEKFVFTEEEKHACEALTKEIHEMLNDTLTGTDVERLRTHIHSEIEARHIERDRFGLNPVLKALMTAKVAVGDIGLRRDSLLAIMLYESVLRGHYDTTLARKDFGEGVATILQGLVRVQELYSKTPVVESENFRNLLLSFAEDMRVVLIMIADRVCLMRQIRDTPNKEAQHEVAEEASYLYAPLAHKLGLYQLKSELEDLSLKYLEHDAYYLIKEKLNATKRSRDAYIERFIGPVSKHLTEAGLKFHIKGRTKSIHSIWQKMKKQKCGVDGIYDLFAIRIILDSPLEKEKMQCWQAYSIVTDMYQPNPKRLRDWISVPKSNGYECLHITVLGPEQKWVEVQIRTERMDEVAEHGLAAHWRYKGVKADGGGMEEWLASIRTALEAGDNLEVMDQFKLDLYEDEVYAFTPKGDLLKFPKGATVLDFAYHIHSRVGDTCVGGKVNGKNVSFRTPLHSGDTVEILTASNQTPKPEWLRILVTSRARAKLRLSLKETRQKQGLYAKELLERRLKNKKLDYDEATVQGAERLLPPDRRRPPRPHPRPRRIPGPGRPEPGQGARGRKRGKLRVCPPRHHRGQEERRRAHHRQEPQGHRLLARPLLPPHLWRQGVWLRHRQWRHQDPPCRLPQRHRDAAPFRLPHRPCAVERQGQFPLRHHAARHRQRRHRHRQQHHQHHQQGREDRDAIHQYRLP